MLFTTGVDARICVSLFRVCGEHFLSHSCFGDPVENRKYNLSLCQEESRESQEVVTLVDLFALASCLNMTSGKPSLCGIL